MYFLVNSTIFILLVLLCTLLISKIGRLVQSKTISAYLGSIQSRVNFAKTARPQIHITVYSHILFHTYD